MIQVCKGCSEEFHQDDCMGINEEDGGPVCFVCLTRAQEDHIFASCLDLLLDEEGGGD